MHLIKPATDYGALHLIKTLFPLCYQDYGALPLVGYQHKLSHLFCKVAAHPYLGSYLVKCPINKALRTKIYHFTCLKAFEEAHYSNLTLLSRLGKEVVSNKQQ